MDQVALVHQGHLVGVVLRDQETRAQRRSMAGLLTATAVAAAVYTQFQAKQLAATAVPDLPAWYLLSGK